MRPCKEIEICNPLKCHAICPDGEELRNSFKFAKCGEACPWINKGIQNGSSTYRCNDPDCLFGETVIVFKNQKIRGGDLYERKGIRS